MSDLTDLEDWLDRASEKVRRNVEIVSAFDLGQRFLFHISPNPNVRKFIPAIGRRQANQEDRTVPRITVAPTLLGCFIGYAAAEEDFLSLAHGDAMGNGSQKDTWRGGYKIYALPFELALKPTSKMVYDSRNSDEHWLTTYNAKTVEYIPQTAGRVFYRTINYTGHHNRPPSGDVTIYVEVKHLEGIRFSKQHFLKAGFWTITGPISRNVFSINDDREFVLKEIDRVEYMSAKLATADLLSEPVDMPASMRW